jgi:hypothetical protein
MTMPKDPIKAEECRQKMSEAAKKRVCSDALRKRRSEIMAERNRSQKHRDQVSKARKGRKLPEWQIEILRESNIGRVDSEETRKKKSESHKGEKNIWYGKQLPEETRKKMSEAKKKIIGEKHPRYGVKLTEETKEKIRLSNTGKGHSEESKCKMAESHTGQKNHMYGKEHTPETRYKMTLSRLGEKNHQWRGGVSYETYCKKFNPEFKIRVRAFFGNKCIFCGKTKEENGRNLNGS